MSSGKTTLTDQPFALGSSGQSVNIELDDFLRRPVPPTTLYGDALDVPSLHATLNAALISSPLAVVQGAIAWPFVQTITAPLSAGSVRRVYLKRMMRNMPEFWQDEDFILDPSWWPPTDFHRSIYRYQAEEKPWLMADLVVERAEQ
jgi:hypothetical protein